MGVLALNHNSAGQTFMMVLPIASYPFFRVSHCYSNVFEWMQVNSKKKPRSKIQIKYSLTIICNFCVYRKCISLYYLKTNNILKNLVK